MSVTRPKPSKAKKPMSVDIKVLYTFNGPNAHQTVRLIQEVARQLKVTAVIDEIQVVDEDVAMRYNFAGSPTVLVNNSDIEPIKRDESDKISFQTRMYGNTGVPPRQMIYDAISRAMQ